jgi:hypothetical protein
LLNECLRFLGIFVVNYSTRWLFRLANPFSLLYIMYSFFFIRVNWKTSSGNKRILARCSCIYSRHYGKVDQRTWNSNWMPFLNVKLIWGSVLYFRFAVSSPRKLVRSTRVDRRRLWGRFQRLCVRRNLQCFFSFLASPFSLFQGRKLRTFCVVLTKIRLQYYCQCKYG